MLLTRVLTAVVLLVVLLAALYSESSVLFIATAAAFFVAAAWECERLFKSPRPVLLAGLWGVVFLVFVMGAGAFASLMLFALCIAIWAVRFVPALALGLPPLSSLGNRLVHVLYSLAVFGCFVAVAVLYHRSVAYLLSVMAIVWVADIGAYFAGKAFGSRKLAPSISPGKSWEGAIGGWLAVLVLAAASVQVPLLQGTFAALLQARFGWAGFAALMTLLVAASVVGDLFESMLKRRAQVKDSSALLPGHGGVLDRVDALVPVLPLAALASLWL